MSKQPPLIGLTGGLSRNESGSILCNVGQAYAAAIQKAGVSNDHIKRRPI
ncbi:MAG: hypothetical protein ACOCYU_05735 [Brevefilum sp.]